MSDRIKLTADDIRKSRERGELLAMITSYDARTASLMEQAGVDIILVGDSLGMVFQGQGSTRPVTLEQMVYHVRAVRRGTSTTHIVGDMPFETYRTPDEALRSAEALLAAGADSVKLEGRCSDVIRSLIAAGIPVMGHLGLLPQTARTFKATGREPDEAKELVQAAKDLEELGCFSVVLECMSSATAREMRNAISIPTIGIGAGEECDGQVLVINDLLGLTEGPLPKFVRTYADLKTVIKNAAERYVDDVKGRRFPESRHSYK